MIELIQGDCLEVMRGMEAGSVDAILTDLPYGTTACKWDAIIPFEPMWEVVKHVLKPRGVFVTTASQPFTSKLVMSNLEWFKYEWVWNKIAPVDFLNVNRRPMRVHESVIVFSESQGTYNPQKSGKGMKRWGKSSRASENYGNYGDAVKESVGYPRDIINIRRLLGAIDGKTYHPTQKPVALYEYLIKTYTNEGDTVLDMCAGSGTTLVACHNTNRNGIGIELDPGYFAIAQKRIADAQAQPPLL